MQKTFSFRRPKIEEINITQQLFFEILDSSFPMFSLPALNAYKKSWVSEIIEKRLEHESDLLLLAFDENTPVGLISGSAPEGNVGTVIWMLVKEKYRRQHIGIQLLSHAGQFYKNLGCHKMKLTAPSEEAKEFYLKQGMALEGFHPNHWYNINFWSLAKMI